MVRWRSRSRRAGSSHAIGSRRRRWDRCPRGDWQRASSNAPHVKRRRARNKATITRCAYFAAKRCATPESLARRSRIARVASCCRCARFDRAVERRAEDASDGIARSKSFTDRMATRRNVDRSDGRRCCRARIACGRHGDRSGRHQTRSRCRCCIHLGTRTCIRSRDRSCIEAARSSRDGVALDSAEAVAELAAEVGYAEWVTGTAQSIAAIMRRSKKSADDGKEALAREIGSDLSLEPRADPPVRDQLAAALDAFAMTGARDANKLAIQVLASAGGAVDTLISLAQEEDSGTGERGASNARRTSLAVLRDLDLSLLERNVLSDLLKLAKATKPNAAPRISNASSTRFASASRNGCSLARSRRKNRT